MLKCKITLLSLVPCAFGVCDDNRRAIVNIRQPHGEYEMKCQYCVDGKCTKYCKEDSKKKRKKRKKKKK